MDLSNLVQRIQDERAAIALNIFLDRPVSDDLRDLQLMVSNNVSLRKFTLVKVGYSQFRPCYVFTFNSLNLQTFNSTDVILQTVNTWPNTGPEVYFESKLKFQIQHSIFRTKVHEIVRIGTN